MSLTSAFLASESPGEKFGKAFHIFYDNKMKVYQYIGIIVLDVQWYCRPAAPSCKKKMEEGGGEYILICYCAFSCYLNFVSSVYKLQFHIKT